MEIKQPLDTQPNIGRSGNREGVDRVSRHELELLDAKGE